MLLNVVINNDSYLGWCLTITFFEGRGHAWRLEVGSLLSIYLTCLHFDYVFNEA